MGSAEPLLILLLGVLIVAIDGHLVFRGSVGYLAEVYRPGRARQVATLATVLFHLVMLGAVALVASVDLDPNAGIQPLLARIGVLLLFTALAHGVTMAVLSRLREQQLSTLIAETQIAIDHRRLNGQRDMPTPAEAPANGAPADDPGF
jgi:hypothetical protein